MSVWHEPTMGDIKLDFESDEVDIYVTHDGFGSIYAILTFKQVEEIYKKIKDAPKT